jgi:hypothetical protein
VPEETTTGIVDHGPRLRIGPTPAERLAALETERDRERAAVSDLEAKLRILSAKRAVANERGRYRRTVGLGFILGLVGLIGGFYLLLLGSTW